jgi:RNase P subunit RPR2
MPKATTCKWNGQIIGIEEALRIRARTRRALFHCTECGERVRAHKSGTTGQAAHFEHLSANPHCSLSEG